MRNLNMYVSIGIIVNWTTKLIIEENIYCKNDTIPAMKQAINIKVKMVQKSNRLDKHLWRVLFIWNLPLGS